MAAVTSAVVASTAATAYAGKKSADAAKDAANAQRESADEATQFQREALETLRSDLNPYSQFGQSALGQLSQRMGTQGDLSRIQAQEAVRNQIDGEKIQTTKEGQPSQFASNPKKMAEYQAQLSKVQNMDQSSPDYAAEQRLLSGLESQLPIEDLVSIDPQTDLAKERLGKYYLEKGITPPAGVPQMQYGAGGMGYEMAPNQPASQYQESGNPLLDQAMQERARLNPMANPLLAKAQQERMGFDPLSNPLLASASERQMAMDPSQAMSPEILQNPLLQALQDDVTRRLTANQAAKGKLGSGGTAEALQNRLVPQAIQFGLQMNELNRQDIADRARLGAAQVGLQEAAMAGRESTGMNLYGLQRQATGDRLQAGMMQEDLDQREIANLMDMARLGQASAAQQGLAGQSAASQMGNLSMAAGQATAQGAIQAQQGRNQVAGALAGGFNTMLGGLGSAGSGGGTVNTNFQPTSTQYNNYLGF